MKPTSPPHRARQRLLIFISCFCVAISSYVLQRCARADVLTGDIGVHDPSRAILCDGTYYVYGTGGRMKYSKDRLHWTSGPSPFFSGVPAWAKTLLPNDKGIWAPDVIFFNGAYHLYYSVAGGNQDTATGVESSPTLDPKAPNYKWTDQGLVVSCHKKDLRAAIDPCPIVDAEGKLWLCFGSNYIYPEADQAIFIMQLDAKTGLALADPPVITPLQAGHIEASYIFYHDGFYYLFWNSGGCCGGVRATYTIHVARSKKISGPYVNKAGKDGGDIFAASFTSPTVGDEHGPGHIGILSEGGIDRYTYHYYNSAGRPVLGEETLTYDKDGWPVAVTGTPLAPGRVATTRPAH